LSNFAEKKKEKCNDSRNFLIRAFLVRSAQLAWAGALATEHDDLAVASSSATEDRADGVCDGRSFADIDQ